MRVLDKNRRAASFWYLHRCDPVRVGRGIDISMLCSFSDRIKLIRNKVFAHIDKDAVFEPQRVCADADISIAPGNNEVALAVETVSRALKQLYFEIHGEHFRDWGTTLEGLTQDFERDLKKLIGTK